MSTVANLQSQLTSLINVESQLVQLKNPTQEQRDNLVKNREQQEALNEHLTLLKRVNEELGVAEATQTRENIAATRKAVDKLTLPTTHVATAQGSVEDRRKAVNEAFRDYLRHGYLRDIISSQSTGGGAFVPQTYNHELTVALKQFAPIATLATTKKSHNGQPVKFPWIDDTANSLQIKTEGQVLTEADPLIGSETILYRDTFNAGIVRVANELISDSAFDMGQLLSDLALSRYARGLESVLTLAKDGAGNNTPNNVGLLNVSPVGTTTATIAGGIGWDDIVALYDSVDVAYLPFAYWQISSKTRTYLLSQKDGFGRGFYTPAPTAESLDTLLGRPVVINQSLASPASGVYSANAKPILFGSVKHALGVATSDVIVVRSTERFAELNETSFSLAARVGSVSLLPNAVKSLQIAAS